MRYFCKCKYLMQPSGHAEVEQHDQPTTVDCKMITQSDGGKTVFNTFFCLSSQTDLEMVVEDLAQKVNRPYLRTPCHKIISAARLVQQKRQEFLASVARGVAPNDSPEPPRRK